MEFGGGVVIIIAVYAALVYDIISATNSSPQTTEINAQTRADTLMKWVYLGLLQAGMFVLLGVIVAAATGAPWWAPALGGGMAGVLLWLQYVHAKQSGLANGGTPTETYGPAPAYGYQ